MKMTKMPLVSVIMSTYNDENYIQEAVQSILTQTYKNIEFIIINDASTDSTKSLLDSISDDRINIVNNKINKKLAVNLNMAISMAKGQYIARMDADDIAVPNRIAIQVEYMEANPGIDIVGSFAEMIGAQSGIVEYPINHEDIKDSLLFENCICHPSVMFRACTMNYLYDINFPAGQDYELWSRLIWEKRFANIPQPLLKYRIHENQTRYTNGKQQKAGAIAARIRMLSHIVEITEPVKNYVKRAFDYSLPKKREELEQIESVIALIRTENERKQVYSMCINNYLDEQFYNNWYTSVGCYKVGLKIIRRSTFNQQYKKCSIYDYIKILRRIVINRRRKNLADNKVET